MATTTTHNDVTTARGTRHLTSTETRPAAKTTELMAYIAAVLAVAIAALVVGDGGDGGADPFSAEQALRYITFLTIGYMISRGLAKSGTRGNDNHTDNNHDA
jgi:hypothetical protein